jgi:hypothetical protein
MKQRVFIALLFGGVAVWMLFKNPWVTPGLACLAASNLAIPIGVWRELEGRAAHRALVLFLALGYLGLAYLLALIVDRPTAGGFWAVFGTAAFVMLPVLWLFHRFTLGKAAHR